MQQFSFIDLFIDLFESAVHVSGDKLAHLQEHFRLYIQLWCVQYTDIGADRWQDSIWTLSPVGSNIGALYQSCIDSQKCSCKWESLPPEACRADPNRSIKKINKRKLLHFVGCLHRCSDDARSHKRQITLRPRKRYPEYCLLSEEEWNSARKDR